MIFWKTFLQSLQLPRKNIVFQMNRIGMDITVIYLFILLFIASIPTLIDRLTVTTGPGADMNIIFILIYFFMFHYLPLTIIVFLLITLIAYIGTWIAYWMGRKLRTQLLWKMTAYITTIPIFVYTVLVFLIPIHSIYLWIVITYTFILLIKIISIYPKRKIR